MEPTPVSEPSEPVWYAGGLQFTCTQCGHCCSGAPGYVWVTQEEIAAIAEFLAVPIGEIQLLRSRQVGERISLREHANGDCVFLDGKTRACTIYPVRPRQCRTWPFWNSNLESPAAWENVQRTCPGAGQGNFVPLEQIQAQASQIDV